MKIGAGCLAPTTPFCPPFAVQVLMQCWGNNRIGVDGLTGQARTFQVHFRVREGDPFEFWQGDPLFLARIADPSENVLK
jgi:hypothetical protein